MSTHNDFRLQLAVVTASSATPGGVSVVVPGRFGGQPIQLQELNDVIASPPDVGTRVWIVVSEDFSQAYLLQ